MLALRFPLAQQIRNGDAMEPVRKHMDQGAADDLRVWPGRITLAFLHSLIR